MWLGRQALACVSACHRPAVAAYTTARTVQPPKKTPEQERKEKHEKELKAKKAGKDEDAESSSSETKEADEKKDEQAAPPEQVPNIRIAKGVGQRVTCLDSIHHFFRQVPYPLVATLFGDGQFDLCGVAGVRFVTGVDNNLEQVARLYSQLIRRIEFAAVAIVKNSTDDRVGISPGDQFDSPRHTIAADTI